MSRKSSSEADFDYEAKLTELKKEFGDRFDSESTVKKENLVNFKFEKVLGEGAFGVVKLALHVPTNTVAAVKILKKDRIIRKKHLVHVKNERRVLAAIDFTFVVNLKFTMQDNSYVYLGMEFINGGEMFTILRKFGKFDESTVRFYASQVVLGLEYIHRMGLVYRDVKPENILLTRNGYLKITDFGFAKLLNQDSPRTYSMCGTPEYIAPEIIMNTGYGHSVDWWSLGILMYELSAGYSPFYANNQMNMMEKIVAGRYKHPQFFGSDLRDIIKCLLQVDLSKRFGNLKDGVNDIKNHAFFKQINWNAMYFQRVEAPYVPEVANDADHSQFDEYSDVVLRVSVNNKFPAEFCDF